MNAKSNMSPTPVFSTFLGASVCLLLMLTGCASNPEVRTVTLANTDLSAYKSFYVLPTPPGRPGQAPASEFHQLTAAEAVRDELSAHGYSESRDKNAADLWVAVQFSMHIDTQLREVVDYEYRPRRYGYGYGYGYGYRSYYGYTLQPYRSVEIEEIREGNMIVDIVDRDKQALIWEGFAQGKSANGLSGAESRIQRTVSEMFREFPVAL